MRVILEYDHPNRHLRFYIHGAPHRRIHRAVLQQYRRAIWEAANAAGIKTTIRHNVELSVLFIDPTGPDLGNLYLALEQALDGKTGKGPTILEDDKQIVLLTKIGIIWS